VGWGEIGYVCERVATQRAVHKGGGIRVCACERGENVSMQQHCCAKNILYMYVEREGERERERER